MTPDPNSPQTPDPSEEHAERRLVAHALGQVSPRGSSAEHEEVLPPAETFPGYDVVREIHRGGQGVVYQAIQRATKQKVAVKVMHGGPLTGSAGRARFEREVQILGQLNHPNIVRIHDSGTTPDGSFFYVMDYISGRPLDEFLASRDRPAIPDVLRLFAKICDAVNAAHLRGIIHRDLKPANVRVDRRGEPIVVDFGLAKVAVPDVTGESRARPMTVTGQFIGSLPWASPEQAEGSAATIDVRTDVYSLGVILYQLLTGQFPYQVVGNMRDVLDNILRAEPARPSTIRRQINDEVETIVLKCLQKDRDRRYQSAGELARDIRHYLQGEPIEAKRDSGWYVIRKTLRRYRPVVTAAAAALVVLVLFAAAMTWSASVQRRLRERAEDSEAQTRAAVAAAQAADLRLVETLMFDQHDRIANLRGTTSAQAASADLALAYLQRMDDAADPDPALLRRLARLNDRTGDVLGGALTQVIGDSSAAAERYLAARGQLDRLLASRVASPADAEARAANARRLAWIRQKEKDFAAAKAEYADAIRRYDALLAADPISTAAPSWRDERARAEGGIADLIVEEVAAESSDEANRRLLPEALALYDRLRNYWTTRAAQDPALEADLDRACQRRAAAIIWDARLTYRAPALTLAREAREAPEDPSARDRRRRSLELLDLAVARMADAQAAALEPLERAERRAAAEPLSAPAARARVMALHAAGEAVMFDAQTREMAARAAEELGDPDADSRRAGARQAFERALAYFEPALREAERLADNDPGNLQAQRDLALQLNKVGQILESLGRFDDGRAALERSVRVREQMYRFDPTKQHARDLGLAVFKLSQSLDAQSQRTADDRERDRLEDHARAGYLESIAHFERVWDSRAKAEEDRDVTPVRRALSALDARRAARQVPRPENPP